MKIQSIILTSLIISFNIYAQDDGPPECMIDCPGLEDIGPEGNPDQICEWIISSNGMECMEDCDEEIRIWVEYASDACYECLSNESLDCDNIFEEEDLCSDFTQDECSSVDYCEWIPSNTPLESGYCIEIDSEDDSGGDNDICTVLDEAMCEDLPFCEWTDEGCIMSPFGDDGGWNDDGGWDDFNCEEITNPEECYQVGCEWSTVTTPNGIFEMCINPESDNDDGPPECLLDCEGIEYVNPEEDPYEACDWLISNFGPNNFFNDCAYDCDEETMMLINEITEACFMCLSDDNIDCADIWIDEDENSCSELSQDECNSVGYCEWVPSNTPSESGYCIEANPGGDDGGTGGGEGCFENGEWYCYGCEIFVNECEFYECTEEGWIGPFTIDDCWIEDECYNLLEDECIGNPNCTWVWDDNPVSNEGYCIESNDNPPGDELAILRLEHTVGLPNSIISVPLILDNLETVSGLQFSISGYNAPVFGGINIESFESMDDCFSASYNDLGEEFIGIIFSLDGCVYEPSEYNHIANILFYVNEAAPVGVEVPLWFNYTLVSDPSGNEIPSYGEGSHITLGMQGDVNSDGEINVLDIVAAVNFAIYATEPTESEFWASDINFDGQINILDIVQLINIILGS